MAKGKLKLGRFFQFFTLPPVRRLLLVALIVALLWWQWQTITGWTERTAQDIWGWGGWGLIILGGAIATFLTMLWLQKLSWFLHYWNYWLGGIAFALAAWGILGILSLGGEVGLNLIDDFAFTGFLKVGGLIVVGIFFVAPRAFFRFVKNATIWLAQRIKALFSRVKVPPIPQPRKRKSKVAPDTKPAEAKAEAPSPEDLRQVAQEVWKKYGESPASITENGWRIPPIDILDKTRETEFNQADNAQRARLIEEALGSYNVDAKVVQINVGPTVTQFGIEPGWDKKFKEVREKDREGNVKTRLEETARTRVKVERITSLANDLALALAAPTIRIEAPVPGKSVVGIEVPNATSTMVSLRGVIETSAFQKLKPKSKLSIALGEGAGGEAVAADLAKMPHLLIAGATGSGKTVCLNTIICCILIHASPNDVRFIMIDPKRVELTPFNSIPHLATPVVVDTTKALETLRWLNREMDRRYQVMATDHARNIEGFNKNKQGDQAMPYLVLVIDELADLMMTSSEEVEHILCRLAQLARATGIHLVVATQRPSVDVVTGLIKANFPTRISFAVTSQVDSRTILDTAGAEKLLGRGDMLYMPTDVAKPKRLQGCFVSDPEVERLVYFWGSQQRLEQAPRVDELVPVQSGTEKPSIPEDPLLAEARRLAEAHTHISASFLQRRLRIGYPRAARLMEQLAEEGIAEDDSEGGAAGAGAAAS